MTPDEPLKRAAGVILWALRSGKDLDYALDKASARQPELTQSDLQAALDYARRHNTACLSATDLLRMHHGRRCAADRGEPDPYPDGIPDQTIGQLLDSASLPWREGAE